MNNRHEDNLTARLMITSRRLNRRCQEADREIATLKMSIVPAVNRLAQETRRASYYANMLRNIYRHHKTIDQVYRHCWNCRIRWWVQRHVWNKFFAIKRRDNEMSEKQ